MQQEAIEIQLWEYIDGTGTAEEKARISRLLATDELWQATYRELQSLDSDLRAEKAPLQVSEGFTAGVMDKIEASATSYAARRRALNMAIRAIGIFFIAVIVLSLVYVLQGITPNTVDLHSTSMPEYKLPEINMPDMKLPPYTSFIAGVIAVIALLAAVDKLLRGRVGYRG